MKSTLSDECTSKLIGQIQFPCIQKEEEKHPPRH